MKKYFTLLILALALFFTGCSLSHSVKGSGITTTEDRTAGYISKIDITGDFTININCGKQDSIKVEAEDNILPFIVTKVEDENLTITTKEDITALREIRITVNLHDLKELDSDGKSKIKVNDIRTDELDVSANEEGVIELEGKVDELNITIDDDAKVLAKSVITKRTYVSIYGDGRAEVNARKYLDAKVNGKGVIDYWGNPEEISIKASGGGSVNKR